MSSRLREAVGTSLISAGIPMAGEIFVVSGSNTDAWGQYWKDYTENDRWFAGTDTFSSVTFAKATSGRNDVFMMAPSSHQMGAAMIYDFPLTHMVGAMPISRHKHRSRINLQADFSPAITWSATASVWSNMAINWGRGTTTNYTAVQLDGPRNIFRNVHIGGPYNAAEASGAGSKMFLIGNRENWIKDCFIGDRTVAMSTNTGLLYFEDVSGAGVVNNVIEDTIFMQLSATSQSYFIDCAASADITGPNFFRNCHFYYWSVNNAKTCELMIIKHADPDGTLAFDSNCMSYGVDAIVSTAGADSIWWGSASSKVFGQGLAIHPSTA